MRTWKFLSRGAPLLVLGLASGRALACGGCFIAPTPTTVDAVVTGHRMAFAVSDERTVLWDQIQYSGAPADFGWVLPVAPGATIELSSDAWFEALETATSAQVTSPQLQCARNSSSGCFSSSSSSALAEPAADRGGVFGPGVTVLHQASLGPFDTVTLRSTDAGSVRAWLASHDYVIQDDVDPIIDAYIQEQMDFIALRLHGDQPMQPVRVVTPQGNAVLPLRMVKAGTGSDVPIVLYAIGEARLGLADLTEVKLDLTKLSFDFATSKSNYTDVLADALSQHLGASFATTFAAKNPFGRSFSRTLSTSGNRSSTQLGQLYFDQGFENANAVETGCSFALTGLSSDQLVTEAQASQFTCGDLSDISAAMIGMHPSRVWLARLDMDLPRDVLGMDCRVNHAAKQEEVSSDLTAVRTKNRPSYCQQPIFESRIAPERTTPALAGAWSVAAMGLVAGLRRLRRRR
jgi:hypothetical protein